MAQDVYQETAQVSDRCSCVKCPGFAAFRIIDNDSNQNRNRMSCITDLRESRERENKFKWTGRARPCSGKAKIPNCTIILPVIYIQQYLKAIVVITIWFCRRWQVETFDECAWLMVTSSEDQENESWIKSNDSWFQILLHQCPNVSVSGRQHLVLSVRL